MGDSEKNISWVTVGLLNLTGMLIMTYSLSVIAVEKANDCIDRQAKNNFKGKVIHGPVSEGQCMKCHAPHSSDNSKGLKAKMPGLCLDCHDGLMKDKKGEHLPSLKAAFENSEMKLHRPFADGNCTCCHDPHASSNYRLLNKKHNTSLYSSYTKEKYVCLRCHSDKAFSEPRTMTETNFRNGNLNLHYRHVNREKGRSCQTCHHHHASKNEALIRQQLPFGEKDITISEFKKTETGGRCASSCHRVAQYDRLEPFRAPMKVSEREGKDASYEELLRAITPATKSSDKKNE